MGAVSSEHKVLQVAESPHVTREGRLSQASPRRGRPQNGVVSNCSQCFNPRPSEEGDARTRGRDALLPVSIHAPAKRATPVLKV